MASADPSRVVVVDDHPALRAGLRSLLEHEPGLRCLTAVPDERELHRVLGVADADVVIMDYALGRGDGLGAGYRVKQRRRAPAVVLYSAYVDDAFAVPAALAQADGVVPKSAPVEVLLDAVRAVAAGYARLPTPDAEEIAETLDIPAQEVRSQAQRIIGRMQAADRLGDAVQVEPALG